MSVRERSSRKQRAKLGVAVVGLGIGALHARAFHADPRCRIESLYDLDAQLAQRLAEEFGQGTVAPDLSSIIANPDVDVVCVASYDDAHFDQVVQALRAGKHVFAEKPLCQSLKQLQLIKQAWQERHGSVKLACNLVLRTAPLYRWLKEKINSGDFGKLYSLEGDYLYGRLHKITRGWRGRIKEYAAMYGGGIHLIDLFLWLTGERPTTVQAVGNQICTAGTDFRHNDFVIAIMQFASGLIGHASANLGCVHRHQHVVRLYGTKATFIHDDVSSRLHWSWDPSVGASLLNPSSLPATKSDLIPEFITAIESDIDLEREIQSIFDSASVSIACESALRTGKRKEIVYV